MSKSLGNVIDPLDVVDGITLKGLNDKLYAGNLPENELKKAIEFQKKDFPNGIPTCGADSLRFTLLSYVSNSRSINLDILRVEGYRRWCNKLWNAVRFVYINTHDFASLPKLDAINIDELGPIDKWILKALDNCISNINKGFENYDFMSVTESLYQFWIGSFCDFYLVSLLPMFLS